MSFEFKEPAKVAGEWVTMKELAKMGEAITVVDGFLTEDPSNRYQGDPLPRFIIAGKVASSGDEVKVSCPNGYSRDDKFRQLEEYLSENPKESVDIKFERAAGSQYIDVTTA